ncbi:LmbE family N-acetylglucosaminyl deacetylase [Halopolyspora algeriensis]|uniref:LmbE family N-acetylglucosaminyl deacetylase n=1 Tax=Halopolyspora algeriensis TaxID=1500506 RepID=A0A368VBG9_9ACTN|nr:PIG-L deacetylase family protein [Halopolyspora algeriensis]RCW37660.1 LmbE family N-acetylglucosaminyl deacetylase [Halopolyspora algeriensis]TQM53806.1 LmbE family N-acetylglucosaminyl deacetylase [Halopolyspora algeriensis]
MELIEFPEDWKKCLVIVAHPDDVEYPGAAPIARWTAQGKEVVYLIASKGEAGLSGMAPEDCIDLRVAEQIDAAAAVGVSTVEFLDNPDGMIEYGLSLRRDIARAIRLHQPDMVLIGNQREMSGNGMLNMADHRVVGQAGIDAVRDAANRWVFRDLAEEPWSGVRYMALLGSPVPTHAVGTGDWFDAGLQSLLAHRTYLEHLGTTAAEAESMLRKFTMDVASKFNGRPGVALEML